MRISVIVPVYNAGAYLTDCLQSIADQQHPDYEVILIDDGSTDGSGSVCDEFCRNHSHFTTVHTPNRGVSAARNLGVERAKGDFVTFVDADDMIHPQFLTLLDGLLRSGAKASMCHLTRMSANDMSANGKVKTLTTERAIELTLYQREYNCSLCGKLLPREALLRAPQPQGLRYEDLATFYKIYQQLDGDIAATTARAYYYRDNPSSYINTFTEQRTDVLTVTDRIVEDLRDNPTLLRAALDRRFSANYNMFLLCSQHGYPAQASRCWQIIRQYRLAEIFNPKVRLKNRLGALLSNLGPRFIASLGKRMGGD